MSPGSYGSHHSPKLSPPTHASSAILSDHRRELAVLQTPQFMFRQNPPSAASSPAVNSAVTTPGSFLNSNIFDHAQDQSSSHNRPGTSNSIPTPNPSDGYFPAEERRPSVASSTGSKTSSRSRYLAFFSGGSGNEPQNESPGSSESSLPPNATPRSHYGFPRPNTPTGSRPRTPVPSADVVPFIYQDPEVRGRVACVT